MVAKRRVLVIGAGMGGLAASVQLARLGFGVTTLEARQTVGGLASQLEVGGFSFDAGPYILLDRPGLEWAFRRLGLELAERIELRKIEDVYEVEYDRGVIRFHADLERTASGFERLWPGAAKRYTQFVARVSETYGRLEPLLHASRPGPWELMRRGVLRDAPFLMKPLGAVLAAAKLPKPLMHAVGIWTQVAAQQLGEAPSPMAFVPALIHSVGAYYPVGGMSSIPRALGRAAESLGVELRLGTKVRSIRCKAGKVIGVETTEREFVAADAVISNYSGIGTYLELLSETPMSARERLGRLPLQSPGAHAYLAVKRKAESSYLRFRLAEGERTCRLLIQPSLLEPELSSEGWSPARLLSPMDHGVAENLGEAGQREYLERMLAEPWWQEHAGEFRVLGTRIPRDWGTEHHLYKDSMNPVMTARFMRQGRIPHRSPHVQGLYLAGSSTHPGQWVSFCAISGVLAAELVQKDLGDARDDI